MKKFEGDAAPKEVRLRGAIEESEKFRSLLLEAHSEGRDVTGSQRQSVEKLTADVRRPERQKSDPVAGFKLQLHLIDVLGRPKADMEVAKVLGFTEEEFTKAPKQEARRDVSVTAARDESLHVAVLDSKQPSPVAELCYAGGKEREKPLQIH